MRNINSVMDWYEADAIPGIAKRKYMSRRELASVVHSESLSKFRNWGSNASA